MTQNRAKLDQRGFVIPLFAAFSTLLVLLLLGWCIDLPTHNAAVVRNQFSSDVGSAVGLYKFWDPPVLAASANASSTATNYGSYYAHSQGLFFNIVQTNVVGIPELDGQTYNGAGDYSGRVFRDCRSNGVCGATEDGNISAASTADDPYGSTNFGNLGQKFFNFNFRGTEITDFRNGLLQFTNFTPYSYFSLGAANKPVTTVSALRMVNTMTGVLINPAMPMDAANYAQIFTADPAEMLPTPNVFPLAAYRVRPDVSDLELRASMTPGDVLHPVLASDPRITERNEWQSWASNGYGIYQGMTDWGTIPPDADIPFAKDPSGTISLIGTNPDLSRRVFNFMSASCDSLPFFYFKSAAVNLIDRFAKSSAFSPTTIVGLTGYEPRPGPALDDAVVPIFPIPQTLAVSGSYEKFVEPAGFPLQTRTTEISPYLHSRITRAYEGWVTPDNFSDYSPNNHVDLVYCAEYYRTGEGATTVEPGMSGALLPDDFSYSSVDAADFNHASDDSRKRSSTNNSPTGVKHWYDDSFNAGVAGPTHFDLRESTTGGDTPRNFVGNLAMRLSKYKLGILDGSGRSQVSEPAPVPAIDAWTRPDLTTLPELTGFNYLPLALKKMCQQVSQAANNYNTDSTVGATRPVQQTAVVVYAMEVYSQIALETLRALGIADDPATDLKTEISTCLCNNPNMKLFLAFLPMDETSRNQIKMVTEDISPIFEQAHNNQCVGLGVGSTACQGGETSLGSLFTLVYDYTDPRFETPGADNPEETSKLAAARAYFAEVHETVTKLLIQWVYAG